MDWCFEMNYYVHDTGVYYVICINDVLHNSVVYNVYWLWAN